jgi:hypothetical protein
MTDDFARALPAALRGALGRRWEFATDGEHLEIRHRDSGTPYRPPRRVPDWAQLLSRLETAFAEHDVPRVPALPLRWRRETDLTISAIQALDPYVKHRQPFTYRSGYLPQPVVRFSGKRDSTGRLEDGYLTSFVNVSRIEPIKTLDDHAAILDDWIGVQSRLGLHARHIEIYGTLRIWRREPVQGITMRYRHAGLELGDIVVIWNADDPTYLVTDLGSGLERLRWAIARTCWREVVHGRWADFINPTVLDALRAAVLLVACGVAPAARGPGSAVRRLLHSIPPDAAAFGLSAAVRRAHQFWSLTAPIVHSWPEVTYRIEQEVLTGGRSAPRTRGFDRATVRPVASDRRQTPVRGAPDDG